MYAFVVKNDEGTWDVWNTLNFHKVPEREERIKNAINSEFPITGMILTPYGETAKSGATWDGENFIGGSPKAYPENTDWNLVTQYGYICNNILLVLFYNTPDTNEDNKLQAIFNSETTIIKVPEGQSAKVGDIWDGTQITSV